MLKFEDFMSKRCQNTKIDKYDTYRMVGKYQMTLPTLFKSLCFSKSRKLCSCSKHNEIYNRK